ncbi:MAG: hypothetical protein K2H12_05250 [Acetatifactor sp.]|nr:hypothetical protein [Acetatifactor sp.]
MDQVKYSCYRKSRKLCPCDGQVTCQAEKVDGMVSQTIQEIFRSISGASEEEKIQDLTQALQTVKKRIEELVLHSADNEPDENISYRGLNLC